MSSNTSVIFTVDAIHSSSSCVILLGWQKIAAHSIRCHGCSANSERSIAERSSAQWNLQFGRWRWRSKTGPVVVGEAAIINRVGGCMPVNVRHEYAVVFTAYDDIA